MLPSSRALRWRLAVKSVKSVNKARRSVASQPLAVWMHPQHMLLLACGAVAADSQAPSKPDLRSVPWMHQRVQVLNGHAAAPHVVRDVVMRIVNPRHPEPLWLSKPEVGLLGLVTYGVSGYVYWIVQRALLQRWRAQGHRSFAVSDMALTLCELLCDPCGEARKGHIIYGIITMGLMRDMLVSICIAGGIGIFAGIASAVLVLAGRGLIVRPLPVRTSSAGSREMA